MFETLGLDYTPLMAFLQRNGPFGVCAAVAFVFALFDFHTTLREHGHGTAPISYLSSPAAVAFFIAMATIGVLILLFFLPESGESLAELIPMAVSNPYLYAACIGFLTPLLIRSKFAEFEGRKLGLEQVYDFARAWSIGRYKVKAETVKQTVASNHSQIENPFEFRQDLIDLVRSSINHRSDEYRTNFEKHVQENSSVFDEVPEERRNELTIRLAIDYLSVREVKRYCEGYRVRRDIT